MMEFRTKDRGTDPTSGAKFLSLSEESNCLGRPNRGVLQSSAPMTVLFFCLQRLFSHAHSTLVPSFLAFSRIPGTWSSVFGYRSKVNYHPSLKFFFLSIVSHGLYSLILLLVTFPHSYPYPYLYPLTFITLSSLQSPLLFDTLSLPSIKSIRAPEISPYLHSTTYLFSFIKIKKISHARCLLETALPPLPGVGSVRLSVERRRQSKVGVEVCYPGGSAGSLDC